MELETPATEVKKNPNKPTRMIVLVERLVRELAMMKIYLYET